MHMWGDDWFEVNGQDLYSAIKFIEDYLHKHNIGVCGKEKYGTYRDEYLHFWDGGLYSILFGYRARIGTFNSYRFKLTKEEKENETFWKTKFNKNVSPKIVEFINKIHSFICFKLDEAIPDISKDTPFEEYDYYYNKRKWKGLKYYNGKIGLIKLIQKYQAYHYNKAFQLACKKWPHIQDELIVMVDGWEMIKPCKWGNIDGEVIHKKYWKTVENKNEE